MVEELKTPEEIWEHNRMVARQLVEWLEEANRETDRLRIMDDEQRYRKNMNMVWISIFIIVLRVLLSLLWNYWQNAVVQGGAPAADVQDALHSLLGVSATPINSA